MGSQLSQKSALSAQKLPFAQNSPSQHVKSQLRMQIGYCNFLDFGEREAAAIFTTQDNSSQQQVMQFASIPLATSTDSQLAVSLPKISKSKTKDRPKEIEQAFSGH